VVPLLVRELPLLLGTCPRNPGEITSKGKYELKRAVGRFNNFWLVLIYNILLARLYAGWKTVEKRFMLIFLLEGSLRRDCYLICLVLVKFVKYLFSVCVPTKLKSITPSD